MNVRPIKGLSPGVHVAGFILLLSACAPAVRNPDITYDVPLGVADPAPLQTSAEPYRIAAQDRIAVSIYRIPELSREYVVEPSGIVDFPLIGEVQVAGLTTGALADLLTERYNRTQLRDPSISVQIAEMSPRTATVEGSVNSPGTLAVTSSTTLLDVIARTGGPSEYANLKRVVVFRQIGGERHAAAFDLRQVREGLMENPRIYPGDLVMVDGSQLRRDLRDALTAVPLLGFFAQVR